MEFQLGTKGYIAKRYDCQWQPMTATLCLSTIWVIFGNFWWFCIVIFGILRQNMIIDFDMPSRTVLLFNLIFGLK